MLEGRAWSGMRGRGRAGLAGVAGRGGRRLDADVALLLYSELVTNSVRHSGSAVPGGVVTVTVAAAATGIVRVEVTDRIGDGVPVLPSAPADGEAEGSRGLWLNSRAR